MNLIVLKPDFTWYTRPDSTLCRVKEDFFLPEEFVSAEVYSCSYIKVTRAGKAIQPKFAGRYFEPLCKGCLYYGLDRSGKASPYIDRSTVLEEGTSTSFPDEETIAAICRASSVMTFRRCDLVIVENPGPSILNQGDSFNSITIK